MIIFPNLLPVKRFLLPIIIDKLIDLRSKQIHFDVMDKNFVGYNAFKISDFERIKNKKAIFNIHLMVIEPRRYAKKFILLGAKKIIFHYEAFISKTAITNFIIDLRSKNVKVGIAILPETDLKEILYFLIMVDSVLIMTAKPEKNKSKFIKKTLKKIRECYNYIYKNKLKTIIEVEGGIDDKNCLECYRNGADKLIIGNYLFEDENLRKRINTINKICLGAKNENFIKKR